ncbi:MAG: NAD(P)/FAD-dependent oxidoreductase [Erysipelotrichaceae bacterium]|nr:NAD(P)/FAD-dependent oxidoreductase [Erysipelotrichaceae bacterium]
MKKYDVIFIGSGHACWHGALILRTLGKSVALVERELNGGTCTNYGCDAKILLDSPIELKEALERYKGIGINQKIDVEWNKLMAYKKQVIGAFPAALEGMFAQFGFDLIKGEAKFVDKNHIEVNGEQYEATNFVIGTGQTYIPLDIPGKEYFKDSRDFLSLDNIPEHSVFVGAGIIGMEFASICLSLGKKVTVIDLADAPLKQYPEKYVSLVTNKMKEQGANFLFSRHVASLEKKGEDSYILKTSEGDEVKANYVLVAVGRKANVDNLNLDKLGISYSARGIKVDNHLRTSVKNIYVSGDAIDKRVPKLTPTAEFESNYIALDILLPKFMRKPINYPVVPNLVFTLPRIGQVGVSLAEANKDKESYRVEEVAIGQTMAWANKNAVEENITFVFNKKNELVGAAIYSDQAGEFLDILTIIINLKLKARDLSKMIFSFPTTTYGLVSSLIPMMLKK